jgi:hypothetical protein
MDDVRVHYNSPKPAQLQALAYTQGTDIHVAPGQEKHLPHEAWHVVQQKQGRVQPTMQLRGVNVNDNEGLEHEADVMGEKILQLKLADPSSVAADMCNENHRKICFNAATEEKYKSFETWKNLRGYPPPKIGDIINRIRPKVHDIPIPVDYQDKGMALPMQNNLINWLRNGKREHMWINNSGTIRVADRNFEKKPHPTLAGGDPDVKCAGLLYCGEYPKTVTVTITNQSGHFKPGDVDEESKQKIENVLNKTEKKTFVVVHNR